MRSECAACTTCPECGREFCRDWTGRERADGVWVCDDCPQVAEVPC